MKITNFKDKTYNRFYELLTEDDDLEDIDDRTLSQTISDIVDEAFNTIGLSKKINSNEEEKEERVKMKDGKPVVKVYNSDFDPNIDYGFNLVFEKACDPDTDTEFSDQDSTSKIIKADFNNGRKF